MSASTVGVCNVAGPCSSTVLFACVRHLTFPSLSTISVGTLLSPPFHTPLAQRPRVGGCTHGHPRRPAAWSVPELCSAWMQSPGPVLGCRLLGMGLGPCTPAEARGRGSSSIPSRRPTRPRGVRPGPPPPHVPRGQGGRALALAGNTAPGPDSPGRDGLTHWR